MKHFTLGQADVRKFYRLVADQHPMFVGVSITSIFAGWVTVCVPNWVGTDKQFWSML